MKNRRHGRGLIVSWILLTSMVTDAAVPPPLHTASGRRHRGRPSLPAFRTSSVFVLGSAIQVSYDLTASLRGIDWDNGGIPGQGKDVFSDWVGLYREGECTHNEPNDHTWHKCYLQWINIPENKQTGTLSFHFENSEQGQGYQRAGRYEIRYFYGQDPGPLGQGYICHTRLQNDQVSQPIGVIPGVSSLNPFSNHVHHIPWKGPAAISPHVVVGHGKDYSPYIGGHKSTELTPLTSEDCACDPEVVESTIHVKSATLGLTCGFDLAEPTWTTGLEIYPTLAAGMLCDGKQSCPLTTAQIETVLRNYSNSKHFEPDHKEILVRSLERVRRCYDRDLSVEYTCSHFDSQCPSGSDVVCIYTTHRETLVRGDDLVCSQAPARNHCIAVRAACANCALHAVSSIGVTVVEGHHGNSPGSWVDTMHTQADQAPDSMPGFEVALGM